MPFVPSATVLLSFVLRLVPDGLADGAFVGQVVDVETDSTRTFRSPDELLLILRSHHRATTTPESV